MYRTIVYKIFSTLLFLQLIKNTRINFVSVSSRSIIIMQSIGEEGERNNYGMIMGNQNACRDEHRNEYTSGGYHTYDPGFDVETLVSPSLAKDGRAEEHIHGAAIPSQAIQTSDSDYSGSLVQFPQGFRPGVRCEQRRRWFVNHVKMFRPRRERANIRFR